MIVCLWPLSCVLVAHNSIKEDRWRSTVNCNTLSEFHDKYCSLGWTLIATTRYQVIHFFGASLSEPHTIVVDRPTNRLVVSVPFTWYWYVAHALTATPPCVICHTHWWHVNSAVRSGDSYKTENADNGKAKSRDTRATNCKAGTRERPANLFILALPCRCRHASMGFTYVSFSRQLLHTNPFSHNPT